MLTVSTSELDRLGRELRAAAAAIVAHCHSDLGVLLRNDDALSAALRSVEHDWSKQRGAIVDYLDKVGQGAHAAARVYDTIEREIAAAGSPTRPAARSGRFSL